MQRRDDSFRTWFVFSRSEKRGITILVVIIFLLMGVRCIQKYLHDDLVLEYERQVADTDEMLPDTVSTKSFLINDLSPDQSVRNVEPFNPNVANKANLIACGFTPEIASRIIRYREKGGVFYRPTDLYRIYDIDSHLVKTMVDQSMIILDNPVKKVNTGNSSEYFPKDLQAVEINSADSILFSKLPGIGQVLSHRIIRYRGILGGFYRIEQLKEVYGINDSLYLKIAENLTVDTLLIRHLYLNHSSLESFRSHPYINDYEAKTIIQYRSLMGSFSNCEELLDHYILSENTYRKVRCYLRLN